MASLIDFRSRSCGYASSKPLPTSAAPSRTSATCCSHTCTAITGTRPSLPPWFKSGGRLWCHADRLPASCGIESKAFVDLDDADRRLLLQGRRETSSMRLVPGSARSPCGTTRSRASFRIEESIRRRNLLGYASDLRGMGRRRRGWQLSASRRRSSPSSSTTTSRCCACSGRGREADSAQSRHERRIIELPKAARAACHGRQSSSFFPGRLRHLIPTHLSLQCNRPDLVMAAAETVRHRLGADFAITPAESDRALDWVPLVSPPLLSRGRKQRTGRLRSTNLYVPFFDGWE